MKKQAQKIVVVMGPTASGKSGMAILLAKKYNGEIISADSRQVYIGLDIGSGKVLRDQYSLHNQKEYFSDGVIHHLIDVANPMDDFNISHFKVSANAAIEKIIAKGKLPIICGGTAFWIDSITKNTFIPEVAPDHALRATLENNSIEELFSMLQELDPERSNNIDQKNKVRLIRAIEICKALGKVPKNNENIDQQKTNLKYKFLQIGILTDRIQLNEKIKTRLEERFANGMIQEVEGLLKNNISPAWLERIGLEYRWINRYLQGNIQLDEMQKLLYFDIIHYAKRQITWLKRNTDIVWIKDYSEAEKQVEKFLK